MGKVLCLLFALFIATIIYVGCNPISELDYCGNPRELVCGYLRNHKLLYLNNLVEGLDCAKKLNKPILVVFSGYGCVGYDAFRLDHLNSPKVRKYLQSDYIFVMLYLDDKTPNKTDEAKIHAIYANHGIELDTNRRLSSLGLLNSAIQVSLFSDNTQVFFGFLKPNGEQLIQAFNYNRKEVDFLIEKLEEGKKEWEISIN